MGLVISIDPTPLKVNDDGVVLVSGTRIPLDTIVVEFKHGASPEDIVKQYTSLDLASVYAIVGYYLRHREEIEIYLQERQEHAATLRAENERRFPSKGLRDRLLARRQAHPVPNAGSQST